MSTFAKKENLTKVNQIVDEIYNQVNELNVFEKYEEFKERVTSYMKVLMVVHVGKMHVVLECGRRDDQAQRCDGGHKYLTSTSHM